MKDSDLAIFQGQLDLISEEMGIVMSRTAQSTIFAESHDYSCFLTNPEGYMISYADGIPMHTGSGGYAVRRCIEYWNNKINDGDLFVLNDPYFSQGSHLPDYTFIMPVFFKKKLIGFTCTRAHQLDIGGGYFGSYNSNAREIFEEGLRLPPMRIHEKGKRRIDVWDLLMLATRVPETVAGDLEAMIGACKIGSKRLKMLAKFLGITKINKAYNKILDYGEKLMRTHILTIPNGIYKAEETMNNDCFSRKNVTVRVAIKISDSEMIVDFKGTDAQVPGFKNSPYVNTCAATYLGIRSIVDPFLPMNEGSYRMITVSAPKGSVVNAQPPAAVTLCTAHPAHEIVHVIWRALSKILPKQVSSGWGRASFPLTSGKNKNGDRYAMYHWGAMGGAGATSLRDGMPQVGLLVSMGNLRVPSLELSEQQFPVVFKRHELRTDGGGAGFYRGGTGVYYEVIVEQSGQWSFRCEGLYTPSGFGLEGASDGREAILEVKDIKSKLLINTPQYGLRDLQPVNLSIDSPGGGGWGNPLKRNPTSVVNDVLDELVSLESAKKDYGVVINSSTLKIDEKATKILRESYDKS